MELSFEAYRSIIKYVRNRADIAVLCRVSRGFRYAAERALYNTLYMRNAHPTIALCDTLATQPRISFLVDAITISLTDDDDDDDDEHTDGDSESEELEEELPSVQEYLNSVSRALHHTSRLRYLNIHANNHPGTASAWILGGCTFHLRRFHCDFDWDMDLVAFLKTQDDLYDLYITDYKDLNLDPPPTVASPSTLIASSLDTHFLPNLSTLECTFSEAAVALIPGRPTTRLKTCFSRSELSEKRAEMTLLFSKIRLSSRRFRSLDIADSAYTEDFSLELLRLVTHTNATSRDLRYLGTFVLPIGGREVRVFFTPSLESLDLRMSAVPSPLQRLQFYGLLMRLHRLQCIEVDISDWDPPPASLPAFRALVNELRLYRPTVTRVIFVQEFDRTVITVTEGICHLDDEISPEMLWREI